MGIINLCFFSYILVIVISGQEFPKAKPQQCVTPPNFDRIRSYSKFVVSKESFRMIEEAYNICKDGGLNVGNILNRQEEEDVEKYIIYENNRSALFIGGMKEAGENKKFLDSYGRLLSYAHFYETDPDYNDGVNECQYIVATVPGTGWNHLNRTNKVFWNDLACNRALGEFKVLCEFKEGTCDLPPQPTKQHLHPLHPSTKFYYSELQKNWTDSNKDCNDLGKLPVSLQSESELNFIRLALINTPGRSINYQETKNITWEDPNVKTNLSFNYTGDESINSKCVNIAVGNDNRIYSQLLDCSLPMFFLCREKYEDPSTTPPTTTSSTTTTTMKPTTMRATTTTASTTPAEFDLSSYVAVTPIVVWAFYGIIGIVGYLSIIIQFVVPYLI